MLGTLIFLSFGVVALVAGGVLLYCRGKQLDKMKSMSQVETSGCAEVPGLSAGTPVEVKGTLRCEQPLRSEMAQKECAYYISRVVREYEEPDRDDDRAGSDRRSETLASNEQFAPFVVEDETGTVGVRPEEAEIDALQVMNRFERDTGGAGITLGGLTVNLGNRERTIGYRYEESILPVEEPVYVLGVVREDGEIGAPRPAEEEEQRFIISYRSEEQLEKKYRRDARILTLIAAGLFLFGAVFVAVGIAAAAGYIQFT